MIEKELKDLLVTHLSEAASVSDTTITVASPVPNKCALVLTNGRTYAHLLQSEVVEISQNVDGVLTITASWYLGIRKSVDDLDWDGLQGNWADGTEVLLLFNEMYYNEIRDVVNGLFTADQSMAGTYTFAKGITITGEPTASVDGSIRFNAGRLQGRQSGVWRDMLTSGLPASTFPYGTVYFDPTSGWTATNQTRMRYNATPNNGPALDEAGEVSVKRKLTVWYSPTAYASMVSDALALTISGQPITIEQDVSLANISGNEATFNKVITETIEGRDGNLHIHLLEEGSITIFDGSTEDVDLKVLDVSNNNLIRIDPTAKTVEFTNIHVVPKGPDATMPIGERGLAVHDGYAINTLIRSGESPLLNGSFDNDFDDWTTIGTPTVDEGVATLSRVGETINGFGQTFDPALSEDNHVRVNVTAVDVGFIVIFALGETQVATHPITAPGLYLLSVTTVTYPGSGNWDTIAFIPAENTDSSASISFVEILMNSGNITQIESKGLSANADGDLALEGFSDVIEIHSVSQEYFDKKEIGYTEQMTIGSIAATDLPGTSVPVVTFDTITTLHTLVEGESGINLANHIKVGEEIGTPVFGMIRYTEANAFEGYYEASPGIGEWKAFRTEEANLPASSPGYTIRYEDGHWKATGLIQAHDDRIELNRDVLASNAIRIGNKGEDVDAMIGMIRYNGDFQGYMTLLDHEGELSGFWVSLTGGGLASGGNNGEFLVYSSANQKWVSARDKILYNDNQITLQGRMVAQKGLTLPPADPSLPGSDVSGGIANQKWVAEHPVPWEEGEWPVAAPDGHWVRVLPADGIEQMQDRIQVWGVIGYETFVQDVELDPESETIPKYGWLDLGATDSEGNSITLPSPTGNDGKMIIIRAGVYTLISDFVVPVDSEELITIIRGVTIQGDVSAADADFDTTTVDGELRLIDQEGFIGIGNYDASRTDNEHPEDFMWQILRKEPTDRSIEPMPGENDGEGGLVPEEGYGSDLWPNKDLVLQYHATAREDALATFMDGFEDQSITLNGTTYTATAAENQYEENYTITLTAPLSAAVDNEANISGRTGVFAEAVGEQAEGSINVTVKRKAATTIPAFAEVIIRIGDVNYMASTDGGNPAVIEILEEETYPESTQSPLLANVIIYGPTGAFAKTNAAVGLNSTVFTVVPFTPTIAPAFTSKSVTINDQVRIGSTLGAVLSDTATVTIDPPLVAAAQEGNVLYSGDQGIAVLNQNYGLGDSVLVVRNYHEPVEALRLTRRGDAYIGKDLFVERNLVLNGPAILGDFDEDTNDLTRGMVRFNGDFEGWNGSYWLSLTRRLAHPQIPFPVLNQPTRLYKDNTLVGTVTDYETAEEVTLDIADNLEVDDQVDFDNGVVAYITDIDGTIITLDRDVRASIVIENTTYYVLSVTTNVLTVSSAVTAEAGTQVLFPNGAVARLSEEATADTTITIDKDVSVFSATISGHYCRRYNNNILHFNSHEALALGQSITLPNGNIVRPILDYPATEDYSEVEVRYVDHYGATLRFDELEGWHYTDSLTVNNEQGYFKEGIVVNKVTSATPTRGMIQWNGDLEVFNGSVWQSLTGYGDQNIPPSDEGNMLVMGETLWQATGDVTFHSHSGPGSAGILKINNILQLEEFADDEMDPSEFVRGMIRHRGDLEYYTGSTWISVTDYYGLPGGHLPLGGFTPGSTIKFIAPDIGAPSGRWEETSDIIIGANEVTIANRLNVPIIVLPEYEGEVDEIGQIKFFEGDFLGKTSGGWASLTARLPFEIGEPGDTLYLHAFADDTSRGGAEDNKAYLPTSFFKMHVEYLTGEDPPEDSPDAAYAEFKCHVIMRDFLGLLKFDGDTPVTAWALNIFQTEDETPRQFLKVINYEDGDIESPIDRLVITDEGIETGNGIFTGDITGQSVVVTGAMGGAQIDISGTSDLNNILADGWIDTTDYDQESGIPSLKIGHEANPGINYTVNTFECTGLAKFSNTIVIGDQKSEAPELGMIRYHSDDFQGWDGEYWHSLTSKDTLGAMFGEADLEGSMIAYNASTEVWEVREILRSTVAGAFSVIGCFCPANVENSIDAADIIFASDGELIFMQMPNLGIENAGDSPRMYLHPTGGYKWMMQSTQDDISAGVNALQIGTYADFVLSPAVTINPVTKAVILEDTLLLGNEFVMPAVNIPVTTGYRRTIGYGGRHPEEITFGALDDCIVGYKFRSGTDPEDTGVNFTFELDVPTNATQIEVTLHCASPATDLNNTLDAKFGGYIGSGGEELSIGPNFATLQRTYRGVENQASGYAAGGHYIFKYVVDPTDFIDPLYFTRGRSLWKLFIFRGTLATASDGNGPYNDDHASDIVLLHTSVRVIG